MEALLIVDVQKDFMPKGALAVAGSESIIPVINALIPKFSCVVASKDWHPKNHVSFALWPPHCISGTVGSEFYDELDQGKIKKIFYKGSEEGADSYSAFFNDNKKKSTGLNEFLKENLITKIVIVGLVLEYCVAATALDGVSLGYEVAIIKEGVASMLSEKEQKKLLYSLISKKITII